MPSTTKTSLGLNLWTGTDKPKREDFNNDNELISRLLLECQVIVSDVEPNNQPVGSLWFDTSEAC